MTKRREPATRKAKSGAKRTSGRTRLSAAQRRRHKAEADRRYYEHYRSGSMVTANLYSQELKKAVIDKLRPLGVTMSDAICALLEMVAEGRIVLTPPRKPE